MRAAAPPERQKPPVSVGAETEGQKISSGCRSGLSEVTASALACKAHPSACKCVFPGGATLTGTEPDRRPGRAFTGSARATGREPGDAPSAAGAPSAASSAPWLHTHIVSLSPLGVQLREVIPTVRPHKGGAQRGVIQEFTHASCQRLREFMLQHQGPEGSQVFGYSLTVPGTVTPDEWRTALRLWSKRVQRRGGCAIWRVELQRRGVPHLHVVLWAPEGSKAWRACSEDWLERCLPAKCRTVEGGQAHAVKGSALWGDSHRWYAYLVAHSSKHKASQLGWKGRQWGVVARARFSKSVPVLEVALTDRQRWSLQRLLRRMLGYRGRKARAMKRWGGWCRIVSPERLRPVLAWVVRQA